MLSTKQEAPSTLLPRSLLRLPKLQQKKWAKSSLVKKKRRRLATWARPTRHDAKMAAD